MCPRVWVYAVQRFARETGDIHSLSTVDVKLVALAHTLEVAAYGDKHLREHPVQVRLAGACGAFTGLASPPLVRCNLPRPRR
jgi:hypothetical protein